MPTCGITRLLSGHRSIVATPNSASNGRAGLSACDEPIGEQCAATATDQTAPATAVEGRYLKSISRWTPERGGEVLACEQIDLDGAILHILEFGPVKLALVLHQDDVPAVSC